MDLMFLFTGITKRDHKRHFFFGRGYDDHDDFDFQLLHLRSVQAMTRTAPVYTVRWSSQIVRSGNNRLGPPTPAPNAAISGASAGLLPPDSTTRWRLLLLMATPALLLATLLAGVRTSSS